MGLACERLHKDLHATAQTQDQVQRRLFLNVVVAERSAIATNLLGCEDETLLVWLDALFVPRS